MWIVYRYSTFCLVVEVQEFTGPFDTEAKAREWSAKHSMGEFDFEEFHQARLT